MSYVAESAEAHIEGARASALASYKNLLADRDGRLAAVHKTNGPGSDRWKRREARIRTAEQNRDAVFGRLQRLTDGKRVSFLWFIFAAIVLAALEAPINKFMLDNILRGSNFDSYVISLFMTFILLLLAHFAGHQTRQIKGSYQEKVYISNICIAVFAILVLAMCVGALTIGRAFYSVAGPGWGGRDIFGEISRQVVTLGPWTAFVKALSDQSAFFLACLNTAGITVAFLFAFITHDSDKVYQSALDEADAADQSLARMEKKYDRMVDKVARTYGPQLANIAAAYGAHNAKVIALKRSRNAQLVEEDRFDLTSLDYLLLDARAEIGHRSRVASENIDKAFTSADETNVVSQFAPRRP